MNIHKIRRLLYPGIHRKKQYIGNRINRELYAKLTMYDDQYICTLEETLEEAYELLADVGFSYEPIASLKIWEPTGRIEDGSFVIRNGLLDPYQLHVHLFDEDDGVIIAGHYEYSWIRHPYKHYRVHKLDLEAGREMVMALLEK